MERTIEIRLPYAALLTPLRPDIPLFWKNDHYLKYAKQIGCDGVEFHCFRPVVREVLSLKEKELKKKVGIKSGHVISNPYSTFWSVIRRKQNPISSKEKLAFHTLLHAENIPAQKALHKLEKVFESGFPITTYNYKMHGQHPFGEYKYALIQTQPCGLNDDSIAGDLIENVQLGKGKASGITADLYHIFEQTETGNRPLEDWKKTLTAFLEAGVLKEVHVQVGRFYNPDPYIPDMEWLRGMTGENPNYNSELGRMIRMVKESNQGIPFVLEIAIGGLVAARLLRKTSLFHGLHDAQEIHQQLVDYIKRV